MTKEEIKSMEEIAKRRLGCYVMDDRYRQLYGRREALYEAMSEYATQCTAPLEARIRELEEGLKWALSMVEFGESPYKQKKVDELTKLLSSSSQTP